MTALLSVERSPSRVHSPQLAQAQTSTLGLTMDKAFNNPLAKKVRQIWLAAGEPSERQTLPLPY